MPISKVLTKTVRSRSANLIKSDFKWGFTINFLMFPEPYFFKLHLDIFVMINREIDLKVLKAFAMSFESLWTETSYIDSLPKN